MGMLSGRLLLSMLPLSLLVFFTVTQTINWYATIAFLAVIPALFLRDQEHTVACIVVEQTVPLKQDSLPLWENGLWAVYVGIFWRKQYSQSDFYHCDIHDGKDRSMALATAIITSVTLSCKYLPYLLGRVMYRIGPRKSTLIVSPLLVIHDAFLAMAQSWVR